MRKINKWLFAFVPMMAALASCEPENEFVRSNGSMEEFGFKVYTNKYESTLSTRAETYVVDTFVLGDDTLALVCTVEDMTDQEQETATRAIPIRGDNVAHNLSTVYGAYNVFAYREGKTNWPMLQKNDKDQNIANTPFVEKPYKYSALDASSNLETWLPDFSDPDKYKWWQDSTYRFFAYAPTSSTKSGPTWNPGLKGGDNFKNDGSIVFSYTVPHAVRNGDNPLVDATVQPDILITSTPVLKRSDVETSKDNYTVPLMFYHPMAAVCFNLETIGEKKDDITIERIALENIYGTGTCTFSGPQNMAKHSSEMISWTNLTSLSTYTAELNKKLTDAERAAMDSPTDPTPLSLTSGTTTFMLIPQTFSGRNASDTAKAVIKYVVNGHEIERRHNLVGSGAAKTDGAYTNFGLWKPGKIYTYRLVTVDLLSVRVDDEVLGLTKDKVTITNTGTKKAYIRAAIVGNWMDDHTTGGQDDPRIVASWDVTYPNGKFDSNTTPGVLTLNTGWFQHTDGYYYYMNPVAGGQETGTPLFTKYVVTERPSYADHLELKVIAQAVEAEKNKASVIAAWGTDVAAKLN